MALHDTMQRVPLADIWVEPGRQRKDVTVDDLLPSIKRQGVLVPVIVEAGSWPTGQPFRLIVGERRLVASRQLGLEDIPARLSSDLDPRESQIIELAENLKRKDLSWQELVGAIARIHQLFVELDPEWTQAETAEQVGVTPTLVSMYLQVHREVSPAQAPDHLRNAGTVREAFNIIKRKEQRNAGDALQQLAEFTMPAEPALPPVVAPATAVPPASSGVTAAAWPAA